MSSRLQASGSRLPSTGAPPRAARRGGARPGLALLLAISLLGPEAFARDEGPRALLDKAAAELEAWDIEAAAEVLGEMLQEAPRAPETAWVRGRVLFEQGKYSEAEKAFAEVIESGDAELSRETVREQKLNSAAAEETRNDEVHESEHFVLRTPRGKDALLAPYALPALERAFSQLTQDLGYQPKAKIRVEVYQSAESLAKVSPLSVAEIKASGTIALCKYNRLMITSPRALLRGYPWLDTLAHEFVHFLVTKKGRGNVPIWLQEGLAKFLETRWRGEPGLAVDEMQLALLLRAARSKELIPFAAMYPSIAKLPTQEKAALAFAEVEAAMRLLYVRGGQAALTELVAAMAKGFSDEAAVAQAYGKPFKEFEADWRADIARPRGKHQGELELQAGLKSRPKLEKKLVFKEDVRSRGKPKDPSASEASDEAAPEPGDADAKRAVRLGEIFFSRGRWGAAALQYGRARKKLPEENPIVARRYAFAQLQLNNPGEAAVALKAAVQKDPQDEAAQALLGSALILTRDLPGARAALEAGIAIDPFDPLLHGGLLKLAQEGKDEKLQAQEQRALALLQGHAPREEPPRPPDQDPKLERSK